MSIDTSGDWWKGTEATDIESYLVDFTAQQYPVDVVRVASCSCGGQLFRVEVDDEHGAAKRTCTSCGKDHFVCDSADYWKEAEPDECACPCGGEIMNLAVGFALYPDNGEVKWLYLGLRCTACGVLGCYADWKIAYEPSRQLLDLV